MKARVEFHTVLVVTLDNGTEVRLFQHGENRSREAALQIAARINEQDAAEAAEGSK